MDTTSNTCYGAPITGNSYSCNIYVSPIYCSYYPTSGIYDKFMNSLDEVKDKTVLMSHLPSDVNAASRTFPGYLTDEELQETQYKGRFWDILRLSIHRCSFTSEYYLYILVDNETVVVVDNKGKTKILGRDCLPYSLQGRYYDEC